MTSLILSAIAVTSLRHTSRDERAQALCANFVLQATNAQGLGTRLVQGSLGFMVYKNHSCLQAPPSESGWLSTQNPRLPCIFCWKHLASLREDCEGWWSYGCRGSVAEHWRLKPEVSWVRLMATAGFITFLYFHHITSKFIHMHLRFSCPKLCLGT